MVFLNILVVIVLCYFLLYFTFGFIFVSSPAALFLIKVAADFELSNLGLIIPFLSKHVYYIPHNLSQLSKKEILKKKEGEMNPF